MAKITLERRRGEYGLDALDDQGHLLQTDSSIDNGGDESGFRPMQLLLAALGSCSAIDMISILKKQRQEIRSFTMEINGEREKDVIPSLWKDVTVSIQLEGNIDADKAARAADLSMEKYCSVAETMRRGGTNISWTVSINQLSDETIKP